MTITAFLIVSSLFLTTLLVVRVDSKPVDYSQTIVINENPREGIITSIEAIDFVSLPVDAEVDENNIGSIFIETSDLLLSANAAAAADIDEDTIPDFSSRIVGGDVSGLDEFPYYVST